MTLRIVFSEADEIVIANVFKSDAIPERERLDLGAIETELLNRGKHVRVLAGADEIVRIVAPLLKPGDVIAILSNGGFGGIYEKLPARLRLQEESKQFSRKNMAKA